MSGLDELSREELIALVLRLHETVQDQQRQIAELNATMARQAERIAELEAEVARLRGGGSCAQLSVRPSVPREEKQARKKRKHSFARRSLEATQVVYHGGGAMSGEAAEHFVTGTSNGVIRLWSFRG